MTRINATLLLSPCHRIHFSLYVIFMPNPPSWPWGIDFWRSNTFLDDDYLQSMESLFLLVRIKPVGMIDFINQVNFYVLQKRTISGLKRALFSSNRLETRVILCGESWQLTWFKIWENYSILFHIIWEGKSLDNCFRFADFSLLWASRTVSKTIAWPSWRLISSHSFVTGTLPRARLILISNTKVHNISISFWC